jgi:ceroid-lipofuscinosis MFS transporter 7
MIIMTLVLLSMYFRDRVRLQLTKGNKMKSVKRAAIEDHANQITTLGITVYDCCILGCMLLNISTKGSISSFETLGISIAESHFDMESARAATIVASCGTIGVIALLSMGYVSTVFTDIQMICGGMAVMAVGILSLTGMDEVESNPSWRFILAIFMIYSVGYPIGHTAVIGLFSKGK